MTREYVWRNKNRTFKMSPEDREYYRLKVRKRRFKQKLQSALKKRMAKPKRKAKKMK